MYHLAAILTVAVSLAASTSSLVAPAPASNSSAPNTGGFATIFAESDIPGACGLFNVNSDLIGAIDFLRFSGGPSSLCGQQVEITNTQNQKIVTITIADECVSCRNANSFDLTIGAFSQIADTTEGIIPISWVFV
ncbi:hypothetical protein HYPSUDRAFT_58950 [Hypholoma sublateritium FD-334 SS-4]|uniref:Uncharacterized protein n=1 Tax=Hypholoma sublateritium (strain FD-334 SS-4) TaxID=945553 RepID=A0A0D2N817_HYPSF|nr:hypothetical protein HYPSUDRAFT_58950 [Hypholoma sublateritium FD-334 SS-4]